jgi:predicted RNase H-like HicB family nuclease
VSGFWTGRPLREADGRWIGDVPELPGVTVYGATVEEATIKAKALALRVIAEEIEHGEIRPDSGVLQFSIASRSRHEPMACDEGAAGACCACGVKAGRNTASPSTIGRKSARLCCQRSLGIPGYGQKTCRRRGCDAIAAPCRDLPPTGRGLPGTST